MFKFQLQPSPPTQNVGGAYTHEASRSHGHRPDCRRKEMAHLQDSLKTNEYKQWMFNVPKPKQQQSITSTRRNINVGWHSHVCSKHMEWILGTLINTIRSILVYPKENHLTLRNVVWYTRWSAQNAPSHTSVRQTGR